MASNSFKVEVDGSDVIRAIERLGYNTQKVIENFLKQEALKWQRDIRKQITVNKSVVSGDLRRSISVQPQGRFSYFVGTNLFYAPYVEYGTRRARAKPYIQPVYIKNAEKFKEQLKAILKEALK